MKSSKNSFNLVALESVLSDNKGLKVIYKSSKTDLKTSEDRFYFYLIGYSVEAHIQTPNEVAFCLQPGA